MLPAADFRGATFSGDICFDGVTFSGDALFERAKFSARARFERAKFSGDARFGRTTFGGKAGFYRAIFSGAANFYEATFSGLADFIFVRFGGSAHFSSATFGPDPNFNYASFGGAAHFDEAKFNGVTGFLVARFDADADFDSAIFSGPAYFTAATFSAAGRFDSAAFGDDARFGSTKFKGDAQFKQATFGGASEFEGASFEQDLTFSRAAFEHARELGPLVVAQRLLLDDCVFLERVRLEVAASIVSARATTFAAGVLMRVRWAEITLDDADFARPSALSAATIWRTDSDLASGYFVDSRHLERVPRPRLLALRGAHVAALSLSNVDLRACHFFGAHGLESLSVEASCQWPCTPPERRYLKLRRYVNRETIAEEHAWRGWSDGATRAPRWLDVRDGADALAPAEIAALYRALRKAREEDKDQPGAGDLYYGEMEMRRQGETRDTEDASSRYRLRVGGEAAILHAYWLLSGYGLRPARALVALALTLFAAAALLVWFGFHEPRTYGRSMLFAIHSALSVFRPPETGLSAGGEIVQIALRLLGPLLLGLTLLAVRARVKR
jgi:hypothetical protein